MADKINTGKVARSVPSSSVVKNVQINPLLCRTPIPSTKKETPKWVNGAPTPIPEGQLTPNTEALNLLAGFASGEVVMEGEIKTPTLHFQKFKKLLGHSQKKGIPMAVLIELKRPK